MHLICTYGLGGMPCLSMAFVGIFETTLLNVKPVNSKDRFEGTEVDVPGVKVENASN
jgi:hypothetical protein